MAEVHKTAETLPTLLIGAWPADMRTEKYKMSPPPVQDGDFLTNGVFPHKSYNFKIISPTF